jgi:hypothetical protein
MNTKRYLYLFFVLVAAITTSCDKDYERVFDETPDSRASADLNRYDALLRDAQFGWKASLYTGAGAGYFYYFDFNENGNVVMRSDFNTTTASETMTGTWSLKALQRTTLTFDTYSYVHLPADPNGDVNGGNNGAGLLSDFEFTFNKVSGDSVILKGLKHNAELILVKADENETTQVLNNRIAEILGSTVEYVQANKGLQLHLSSEEIVSVAIDVNSKMVGVQYLSSDRSHINVFTSPFSFTVNGIALKSSLQLNDHTINSLRWDDEQELYRVKLDGDVALVNATEPLIFEPSVPLVSEIGKQYKRVFTPKDPEVNRLPGESDSFVAAYNEASLSLQQGAFELTLEEMVFIFDPATKQIYQDVYLSRTSDQNVTTRFLAEYIYDYEINPDNTIKLTQKLANDNGYAIAFDLRKILQHLEEDSFQLQYIAGGFELIAGFYSQEDPGYSFSGYLRP